MDFITACLLLILWYVRPQDIFAIIGGVSVVKYLMYIAIFAMVRRVGGFTLSKVFKTPIDFLMAAYCLWIVYATPDHNAAAKEAFNYFAFYLVTALAVSSWNKMEVYLNWWLVCLGIVALLAISSHYGFELVAGSSQLTTNFHDRLTLNTWIFRNPNALAHGIIALMPAGVVWFLLKNGKHRVWGAVLLAVGLNCVWLTQSKGAFMAGAGALALALMFKKPLWFQLTVVMIAWGAGLALLMTLPRMDTLNKDDEGIQGRMIVWQQAKASMESTKTGEGLKNFQGYTPVRIAKIHRTLYLPIATHGSYVRHGADLGYIGLMLYLGIFYAGARILIQGKTPAEGLPRRVQTTLFALVAATSLSVWIVDRAYHTDFFLLAGVLSAFHRLLIARNDSENLGEAALANEPTELNGTSSSIASLAVVSVTQNGFKGVLSEEPSMSLSWKRIGIVDVLIMYGLLRVTIYYWNLLSTDFIVF